MEYKTVRWSFFCTLLIAAFVAAGCAKTYKVSGKVLYEDDGTPVTYGIVSFFHEDTDVIGSGRLKPDGSFTLGIKTETDGIPKGNYVVTIETTMTESTQLPTNMADMRGSGPVAFSHLIDTKYASSSRSGLKVTVPAEDYTFRVERYKR